MEAISSMDDRGLLARYAESSDQEAFAELVRRNTDMIYNTCARRLRNNASLASDATQATFVILARKAAQLRNQQNLAGWLYRTAVFSAMAMRRSEKRRDAMNEKYAQQYEREATAEETVWAEAREVLDSAIGKIGLKYQEVVVLHYFQSKSYDEVATALGCEVGTVRIRLERAREKLRAAMAKPGIAVSVSAMAAGLKLEGHATAPAGLAHACVPDAGMGTTVWKLAEETLRAMFWAKMKVATAITATVMGGIAVPAAVATLALSGPSHRHAFTTNPSVVTNAPPQVEVIYDDHFSGTKLSDFWEKASPTNQVAVNDLKYKSALVFRASAPEAPEKLSREVKLISRGIDLSRGIVEVLVEEDEPYSLGYDGVIHDQAVARSILICDDSGKEVAATPLATNPMSASDHNNAWAGEVPAVFVPSGSHAKVVRRYLFSSGYELVYQNAQKYWFKLASSPASVHLQFSLKVNFKTYAIWPVEHVVVRRLQNPPADIAMELAGLVANTRILETAAVPDAKGNSLDQIK